MTAVLSYSEAPDLASEVSAAAAEVGRALGAESVAVELDEVSPGLRADGRVVLVKGDRTLEGDPDSAAEAIIAVARERDFRALLVGDTRFGTTVAGKVSAKLRVPSIGRGKAVGVEAGRLVAQRDVYAGKFLAKVAAPLPCIAVVQAGAYIPRGSGPPAVETVALSVGVPPVKVVGTKGSSGGEAGIKSASIIVSAGRGFAKKEDLAIAQDLAGALGAAVGCSRPLSSDLAWLGEEAHIGLTGAYVHPKLYLALGISGQLQHVAGIKGSKVIVAINKDPQAPIFQVADYGIVGDLYAVVPALTKMLKKG